MATKNPITGDLIQSIPTKQYSDNYGQIDWSKKDINHSEQPHKDEEQCQADLLVNVIKTM